MWMPEGLRSTSPTFCRMTKATLKEQVGKNIFTYVHHIEVASKKKTSYISNLTEIFANMYKARLKLNLEKSASKLTRAKVFRCLVSLKGIKVNADKIRDNSNETSTNKKRCPEVDMQNSSS
jgi:hypothetical protein